MLQCQVGGVPLVEVHGEVDHSSSRSLAEIAGQALGDGCYLLFDLEDCPYMDSGGVAVLLSILARIRPQGWLGVIAANADLLRIFTLVGLSNDASFRSFLTREDAAHAP